MGTLRQLELSLPPEPGSVGEARAKVLEAVHSDIGSDHLETLRLLVSEVVTNAVRHGSEGAPVQLHASWNSHVRVEVVDDGAGFTPAPRNRPLEEPGGFGLFLVGTLADRWGVETNDGTTVWFELEAV
jgi:anti-sigma regulatory factor (Ser/Thr protein kinase)